MISERWRLKARGTFIRLGSYSPPSIRADHSGGAGLHLLWVEVMEAGEEEENMASWLIKDAIKKRRISGNSSRTIITLSAWRGASHLWV